MKSTKKTFVSFNEPSFEVDKELKVVTCKITATINRAQTGIAEGCLIPKMIKALKAYTGKSAYNYEIEGRATCTKEDEFDEILGKRIAESKAKKTAFKIAANWHKAIIDSLAALIKEYDSPIMLNCANAAKHEEEHIKYLTDKYYKNK